MTVQNNGMFRDRELKFFSTVADPAWGYTTEQRDTFAVEYPKDYDETKSYPLYVVFHSAGHGIYSTIECLYNKGNHDIYHTPDDMFGLFLDCRTNSDNDNDWWWGGTNPLDENSDPKRRTEKQPVEHRCIATVEWVMDNYPIDANRVYAVGNSMGGSGALGVTLCRGDIFAAIKVNVPAGVRHVADRCCLDTDAPEGFILPDPPVVVDYSAQNDVWSTGHEILYKSMREKRYALHGYWGAFGHENNNGNIAIHNDLVHALPVFEIKKNEAYPVFTNAETDDKNPWEYKDSHAVSGQVNGFFRWENVSDTEEKLEMKLWLLTPDEWATRVTLPEKTVADLLVRRVQNFKLPPNEEFMWTLTSDDGEIVQGTSRADSMGYPVIERIAVMQKPQTLEIRRK
ncbi:MAG: hypothetical protein E7578_06805 [Ruminococcaceae bacterium]|nr:hypothetical protein [Oscillospiraceae bacterium]